MRNARDSIQETKIQDETRVSDGREMGMRRDTDRAIE